MTHTDILYGLWATRQESLPRCLYGHPGGWGGGGGCNTPKVAFAFAETGFKGALSRGFRRVLAQTT